MDDNIKSKRSKRKADGGQPDPNAKKSKSEREEKKGFLHSYARVLKGGTLSLQSRERKSFYKKQSTEPR